MMGSHDMNDAIKKAHKLAERNGREYFVVRSVGEIGMEYSVADEYQLDTFYAGISQNNILHSTVNDGQIFNKNINVIKQPVLRQAFSKLFLKSYW